jgi:hypothetical protein
MSRYAFSLPEPRQRDGWFKIGSVDVTTTALIVGVGVLSMLLYALDPDTLFKGAYVSELVRDGEVWRLVTWPLVNPPLRVWDLINLAVFWFLGHWIEDDVRRKPYTVLVLAMTIIPAVLVTLFNLTNETGAGRWSAFSYSVVLLSIGMISIFGIDHPNVKFFFGIPAWVIAAAIVFIDVLRNVGDRLWAQLILELLVIAVGLIGARQIGLLDNLAFIPRIKRLAPASPYGGPTPSRRGGGGGGRGRGRSRGRGRGGDAGTVVSGPWSAPSGPTPLEQAELDVLLDKISAGGIDSLTRQEKDRLNHLSKRMRGS